MRQGVVLNAMIVQISRTLGPALAGFIIGWLGAAAAFWLNGLSFGIVIASLLLVRSSQLRQVGVVHPLREFREGLRFIRGQPRLLDLILFMTIIMSSRTAPHLRGEARSVRSPWPPQT